MGPDILVPLSFFLVIFGIFYLYYTTRNKERMALIEKGVGADLFVSSKKRGKSSIWKILTLNTALLAIGIGLGVFLASLLNSTYQIMDDSAYPALIFMMGGLGLLVAYFINKKEERSEEESDEV